MKIICWVLIVTILLSGCREASDLTIFIEESDISPLFLGSSDDSMKISEKIQNDWNSVVKEGVQIISIKKATIYFYLVHGKLKPLTKSQANEHTIAKSFPVSVYQLIADERISSKDTVRKLLVGSFEVHPNINTLRSKTKVEKFSFAFKNDMAIEKNSYATIHYGEKVQTITYSHFGCGLGWEFNSSNWGHFADSGTFILRMSQSVPVVENSNPIMSLYSFTDENNDSQATYLDCRNMQEQEMQNRKGIYNIISKF